MWLACCVPAFELVAPLGLFSGNRARQGWSALALSTFYLLCAAFHVVRVNAGRTNPCSCFGPVFSVSPVAMLYLCVGAALVAAAVTPAVADWFSRQYRSARTGEQRLLGLAICSLAGAFAFRLSLAEAEYQPAALVVEPVTTSEVASIEGIGTLNVPSSVPPTRTLVAVVDPRCRFSAGLLSELNSMPLKKDVELLVVFNPVLSSPSESAEAVTAIAHALESKEPKVSPKLFEPAFLHEQMAFCDRFSPRTVPALFGYRDGHMYRLRTGRNVRDAINQFSKLRLGRD